MKYSKHRYIFFVFVWFFITNPSSVVAQSVDNPLVMHIAPPQQFVGYLKNVAEVLRASGSTSADWAMNRVKIAEGLLSKIQILFDAGAFERLPLVQRKFYAIFDNLTVRKWPTPALVRAWQTAVKEFKNFLLAAHFTSSPANDFLRELDHKLVDLMVMLCCELSDNILTEDFFNFSTFELLADVCVDQPVQFVKNNPFLVIGGCVVLAAGAYLAYSYFHKEKTIIEPENAEEEEIEEVEAPVQPEKKDTRVKPKKRDKIVEQEAPPQEETKITPQPRKKGATPKAKKPSARAEEASNLNEKPVKKGAKSKAKKVVPAKSLNDPTIKFILGSQKEADCAIQSLYRQWCYEQSADLNKYEAHTKNAKQYTQFKTAVRKILVQVEKERLEEIPEEDRAKERRRITTDWLENQDVRLILEGLNEAALMNHKFGIKGTRLNPYVVDSYQYLAPERVEGQMYEDLELKDRHGNPVLYGDKEAAKRERRLGKSKPRAQKQGLRYEKRGLNPGEPGFRQFVEEFQAEPGRTFDFIINSNEMPEQARAEDKKNPPADGHFFHVRAINDPEADKGIRFIISETMRPNYHLIDTVVDGIRFLLRPYEE